MSFGQDGLVEHYDETSLETALRDEIDIRAQAGEAASDRTLIVIAAGNSNNVPCRPGPGNTEWCIPCPTPDPGFACFLAAGAGFGGGNVDATSPAADAALQYFFPELRSHVVAVVATDRTDNIAIFSNRCGLAAKWCIAAPGVDILVADFDAGDGGRFPPRRYYKFDSSTGPSGAAQGTSFAAPYVTGGLAVLMHYFPGMGNDQILMRLYMTADRSGAAAPDPVDPGEQCPDHLNMEGTTTDECELSSIFGWGRMDLDEATRPQGGTAIALGDTLYDLRVPVASSGFRGGAAFGDALAAGWRGREMTVFDALDAPFRVGLDRFVAPAAVPAIGGRLARFLEPDTEFYGSGGNLRVAFKPGAPGGLVDMPFASTRLRVGIHHASWEGSDSAGSDGHASLIPLSTGGASATLGSEEFQFSAFATSPKFVDEGQGSRQTVGAMVAWNPAGGPLGFRFGGVREFGSSLGLEATGAFGEFASGLAFAGAGLRAEAGGWQWSAAAELGRAAPKASSGSSVQEVSGLTTSAFSLSGERLFRNGGRLRLSAVRPLRVEQGRLRINVATGRDKQRNVLREIVDASLAPSGQQLDLGAEWRQPAGGPGGELRLGAVLSLEPGHAAERDPELALMAGWLFSF